MATKQECIEQLTALKVEFDPEAHVATLNKLLKEELGASLPKPFCTKENCDKQPELACSDCEEYQPIKEEIKGDTSIHLLQKDIQRQLEEAKHSDNYEIKAKDKLKIGVTGKLNAVIEGILPCGGDRNHPYTRYKINIDGDRHLMSERLVKKLFIKEEN